MSLEQDVGRLLLVPSGGIHVDAGSSSGHIHYVRHMHSLAGLTDLLLHTGPARAFGSSDSAESASLMANMWLVRRLTMSALGETSATPVVRCDAPHGEY